jgi:hypothetical protein
MRVADDDALSFVLISHIWLNQDHFIINIYQVNRKRLFVNLHFLEINRPSMTEPPRLMQLNCKGPTSRAIAHLNWTKLAVHRIKSD